MYGRPTALFLILLGFLWLAPSGAQSTEGSPGELLDELDRLHYYDRNEELLRIIDTQRPRTSVERGRLLWRQARARVAIAELSVWEGTMSEEEAIALLEEAEALADEAIRILPDEADPRFWRAAATGLRGLLRGVLNSLFLASDVRDYAVEAIERNESLAEGYYLLGQVYRELPGWPISFGNNDYAVSFSRRSIALYEEKRVTGEVPVDYHDHYIQLAMALWNRNNSMARRDRRRNSMVSDYREASTAFERGQYFEGATELPRRSDREEAMEVLRSVIARLSSIPDSDRRVRHRMDLDEALSLLADWE
jgi:tetratricopeptide (TPR) repeat protein